MYKKITFTIIVLILLAGVIYKTNHKSPVIDVGVIIPLTGIAADYGEEIQRGILSTRHEGVNFIFEDEKCEPKETLSAFKKLTELDHVKFIIGPGCGGPQEIVAPLLKGKDILAIVPSAASSDLYSVSGNNLYNIQYSLEDEASFIAERMYNLGYKNVAIVHYANAFSDSHTKSFKKSFKGTIVSDVLIQSDAVDVSTELIKIRSKNPDAIFSTDISFFFSDGINKSRRLGITQPIFSPYTAELPAVRKLAEGVIYSFPSGLTGSEGAVFDLGYASAETFVTSIKSCGEDYACIKSKIDKSGKFKENGVSSRAIILKQIKDGKAVEYKK